MTKGAKARTRMIVKQTATIHYASKGHKASKRRAQIGKLKYCLAQVIIHKKTLIQLEINMLF